MASLKFVQTKQLNCTESNFEFRKYTVAISASISLDLCTFYGVLRFQCFVIFSLERKEGRERKKERIEGKGI